MTLEQRDTRRGAKYERSRCKCIGDDGRWRDDRGTHAAQRRVTSNRVENVVIIRAGRAATNVVARCTHRSVGHTERLDQRIRIPRMPDSDTPWIAARVASSHKDV